VSYALNGISAKKYWNQYAKMCQGMADEGACLNRAIQHGANVTFSADGLGQITVPGVSPSTMAVTQQALAIAANLTAIGAQLVTNPDNFARTQAPRAVNVLDEAVITPLVDRVAQRATPYFVRYVMPPLAVLYVLSGMAAFFSYKVLEASPRRVSANRRRRRRR
jgi:hypothetical protein